MWRALVGAVEGFTTIGRAIDPVAVNFECRRDDVPDGGVVVRHEHALAPSHLACPGFVRPQPAPVIRTCVAIPGLADESSQDTRSGS